MEEISNAFMQMIEQYMQKTYLNIENNFASIKNLEIQVSQISNLFSEQAHSQTTSSQT